MAARAVLGDTSQRQMSAEVMKQGVNMNHATVAVTLWNFGVYQIAVQDSQQAGRHYEYLRRTIFASCPLLR